MQLKGLRVNRKAKLHRSTYSENTDCAAFSLNELLEIYLHAKQAEGVSKGTVDNKKAAVQIFNTFLNVKGLNVKPSDITTDLCREFISYMRCEHVKHEHNNCKKAEYKTAGLSEATINTHLRHLRAMFNFLLEEQYVSSNPFNKVKQVKEPVDVVDALTTDEINKLLRIPDKRSFSGFRDMVLMALLLDTGLRITEALSLTVNEIDFKTNTLLITGKVAKNNKSRYVPFSNKTGKLLRELIAEVQELDTPFIFVTVYGNQLDKDVFRNRVKQYAEQAGIKRNITVHMFRHTFAKYYLLNNGDILTLQKILGHSSLAMVRRYIQLDTSDITNSHAKYSPINTLKL